MNILSISLVTFILFDQLLALATPFSSGLGLVLFIVVLAISAIPKVIKQTNKVSYLMSHFTPLKLIIASLILVYSLVAATTAPCNGYWFFSLATTLLIIFTWMFLTVYVSAFEYRQVIEPSHALVGLIIIYLCLCMASFGFDLYSLLLHAPSNRPSGLYLEPSHLILYASPLIFTVISNQQTRIFGILLTVFIFVLAFTVTSVALTILVMFCYTLHYLFGRSRLVNAKNLFVIFLAMILFAVTLHGSYLNERLKFSKENSSSLETRSMSTQVYLNGWLLAKVTLLNTSGMGLGLGTMGCSEAINNDKQTFSAGLKEADGEIVCVRNGSFLISKIISELGIFGILIIGVIIYHLIRLLISGLSDEFDLITVGAICLLLIQLFIRGMTYFSAPIIFCVVFMTIVHERRSKKFHS